MRIRFIQALVGLNNYWQPGTEVEWTNEAEAIRLVEAGIAASVDGYEPAKVETATLTTDQKSKVKISRHTRPREGK